jgi:hypothetical protein
MPGLITLIMSLLYLWRVNENLESKRVVLVVPQAESVVQQQEPVGAEAIAVEELLALPVTGLEFGPHSIVNIILGLGGDPCEIFIEVVLLARNYWPQDSLPVLFPESDFLQLCLEVPRHQIFISLYQCPDYIWLGVWLLSSSLFDLIGPLCVIFGICRVFQPLLRL